MASVSAETVSRGFAQRKALKIKKMREEIADHRRLIASANQAMLKGVRSMEQGKLSEALDAYNDALVFFKKLQHRETIAQVMKVITLLYQHLGTPESIRASYDKSRDFFRRCGFKDDEARLLVLRAGYEMQQGEMSKAKTFFLEALSLYRDLKDKNAQAQVYTIWANFYSERGQLAEARATLKKAGELFAALEGDVDEGMYKAYRAAQKSLKELLEA